MLSEKERMIVGLCAVVALVFLMTTMKMINNDRPVDQQIKYESRSDRTTRQAEEIRRRLGW